MPILNSLVLLGATLAAAAPTARQSAQNIAQLVHQFPNGTWIENFTFRPNGMIVATDLVGSRVYHVDQFAKNKTSNIDLLLELPANTAISGITEVEADVFYFAAIPNSDVGSFNFPPNTSSLYRLDLTQYTKTKKHSFSKIFPLTNIGLPNGLSTLNAEKGQILIADSTYGTISRVNVFTGESVTVVDDPVLKNVPGAPVEFGANGVQAVGDKLYFSSFDQGIVGYFPVDCNAVPTGKVVPFTHNATYADDFAIGDDGSVWLAENIAGKVVRIFPNGTIQDIYEAVGPVSARFGRRNGQHHVLFVSTDGFEEDASGVISKGKIVSIDTRLL